MFKISNKSFNKLLSNYSVIRYLVKSNSNLAEKRVIYSPKLEEIQNFRRNEEILFDKTYYRILSQLSDTKDNELLKANQWFRNCIEYNVPKGKRNRGLMAVISYHSLAINEDKTPENLESVRALGWSLELFQTYFLMLDDIMDNSITRRGQMCWYRQPSVGLIACNDSTLIESAVFYLIKLYFKDKPFYTDVIDLVHETFRKTAYGQCLDMLSKPNGSEPDLNSFTFENYSAIVKYKTSFYTFVLPVRLAMYLTNHKSAKDHQIVEQILLKIGHLFQAQDDYLDCFGDPSITGKIGTDIEDGKCCWNVVTALDVCSQRQNHLLREHYGKKDTKSVSQIKQIYEEIGLKSLFKNYEKRAFDDILQTIDNNGNQLEVPLNIFDEPLSQIYKRNK